MDPGLYGADHTQPQSFDQLKKAANFPFLASPRKQNWKEEVGKRYGIR